MSQISFADAEYAGKLKKTRREVFFEEMELVVPWKVLLKIIESHYTVAGRGRRPYALESMLRVHLMQNWFALSVGNQRISVVNENTWRKRQLVFKRTGSFSLIRPVAVTARP